MKRAAYFLCAPAVCLALFWRVLFTWFRNDDFAWLSLPLLLRQSGLVYVLFHPQAQGTVRVLSDRLFFLTLTSLFGLHAAPFRAVVLLTWFAALGLAALVGTRLTGSRAAGLIAALLWTTSHALVMPLGWASLYEVVLCAFFMLLALYARMRKQHVLEWTAYLLGFGAQESTVMYPLVALLYNWCTGDRKDRSVYPLFIPAAIFGAVHAFVIPRTTSEIYRVAVDARLPGTAFSYLRLALGPGHTYERWIIGPALAAFLIWQLWRRSGKALFCAGWFALFLAPVLPLPNHISLYYLTVPLVGFAWLGGWGVVKAWESGWGGRAAAVALVALYLAAGVPTIEAGTAYYLALTSRMRFLVRGVQAAVAQYPGTALILQGVDKQLFQAGFQDNPFLVAGVERAYLAPGTETGMGAREDLGGVSRFQISSEDALRLIETRQARVLDVASGPARDVTHSFETVARAEFLASHRTFVDVGQALYAARLGPSWYPTENGFRWMPKSATVQLSGPASPTERLYVTGYGAPPALASGPVKLLFRAGGIDVGSFTVTQSGQNFACDFPLPAKLIGQYAIDVTVEAARTFRPPQDPRELGMIFGTFAIH